MSSTWAERLAGGFRRTSDKLGENLSGLFGKAALDADTLDQIEEALIVCTALTWKIAKLLRSNSLKILNFALWK